MSDYEKAVVAAAAQIYTSDLDYKRGLADPEGKGFSISEAITEAIQEAYMIVDGVIECR